ncbi:SDR family oxidoreductase [Legionella israelensis]|uniref:SDR family oxidoreductase n=1 Tax=Legionella israelensis TaxID=454 RepID=UPI00163DBE0C|nr:SDR family oxidoreductase [Legionella israelensis]
MTDISLNFDLKDQVILVTGATGYLGQAITNGIAKMGGIPVLIGRRARELNILAEDIRKQDREVDVACYDLLQKESYQLIIGQVSEKFGKLNGIVNCAHSGRPGTIQSADQNDFELAQKINLNAPFFLVQEGLELLKRTAKVSSGGASVVNIASMYGQVSPDPRIYGNSGINNPPYYGAAKAGLIQLTRYMACHLGAYNIRVNSLTPGPFPPSSINDQSPKFHSNLCEKNPLGRIGSACEIVGPVIFLLSSASSFVTGANLAVDGGWTSW